MGTQSIAPSETVSGPSFSELQRRSAASHATSSSRRRSRRIGAAAASGLLGLTFLPLAVAHGDDWTLAPDPGSKELITGIYGYGFQGEGTAPPAVPGSIQGNQVFDWTNVTANESGKFVGYESYTNDYLGGSNNEVYVAGDVTGAGGPSVGSVFDTYTFGDGAYTNTYSAIPNGDGTATITDALQTPTGTIVIPTTFDAADGMIAYAGGVPDGIGSDTISPLGSVSVHSISGIPPLDVALQGTQTFDIDGNAKDTFTVADTPTTDVLGTYTEAVVATSPSTDGSIGDGSIFNTINFFGYDSFYSDVVSTTGGPNTITETIATPLGNSVIPLTFDAAEAEDLSNSSITLPNGAIFDPTTELGVTGVNGLPPVDVSVQGGQGFSVLVDGASAGTFTADVTNTLDEFVDSAETILVTSSTDAAIPKGSEFEIVNLGNGYESIYSDIASATAGQDVITETLVTPFGDISMPPSFDAAAGLINDMFTIFAGGDPISGI